jgi:hypothetical protein
MLHSSKSPTLLQWLRADTRLHHGTEVPDTLRQPPATGRTQAASEALAGRTFWALAA